MVGITTLISRAPVLAEGETGVSLILTTCGQIITSLLTQLTAFTNWILGNDLAVMFFAIMFIMLAIHLLHSLVHKFA